MKKVFFLLLLLASLLPSSLVWADAGGADQGDVDAAAAAPPTCASLLCKCTVDGQFYTNIPLAQTITTCDAACYENSVGYDVGPNAGTHTFVGTLQCLDANGQVVGADLAPYVAPVSEVKNPIFPCLNVPIPGLSFGNCDEKAQNIPGADPLLTQTEGGIQESNLLGEYVRAVYVYLLLAGSVMAITMLMIAGVQYATARGSTEQVTKAKTRMQNAVVGVILLLLAYNIAFLVNPATVTFEPLSLDNIKGIPELPPEGEDTNVTPRTDLTGTSTKVIGNHLSAKDGVTIDPDVLKQLQIAVDDFYNTYQQNVYVSSGTRTLRRQAELFYENCLQKGGVCSPDTCNPSSSSAGLITKVGSKFTLTGTLAGVTDPGTIIAALANPANANYGNCPHTSAVALDVWCAEGPGGFQAYPKCQAALITSMTSNGFCRLSSEVWHFELDSKSVSTACLASNNGIDYSSKSGRQTPGNDCLIWDFKKHVCAVKVPVQ